MTKQFSFGLFFLVFLRGGDSFAYSVPDCTQIVSRLERLACFDKAAGTPAYQPAAGGRWSAPELNAPTLSRVLANERLRGPDDLGFRMANESEVDSLGRRFILISAPAIGAVEPRPYLAISCVQNISRLQLLTARPVETNRVTIRLRSEHQTTSAMPWQVMENGQVLDAGRGLPAIEQIKTLIGAQRIQVFSDHPALNGLSFDAQGLDPLIVQARQACRW